MGRSKMRTNSMEFTYQESTETIRISPQNYMLAKYNHGRIILDFDYAIPDRILFKTIEIMKDNTGTTPWIICERLNFAFNDFNGIQTRENI
jgi:hypothetical protein